MARLEPGRQIDFVRLSTIPPERIDRHMSDPRVGAHLPLLDFAWSSDRTAAFVAAKEACWQRDGLGHWAILVDGRYAGWGGFQREGDEGDFGLVLTPEAFGLGAAITRKALDVARADPRISFVTFLLAPSRRHLRGLDRIGARFLGTVRSAGAEFLKYRLDTAMPDGTAGVETRISTIDAARV